MTTNTTPCEPLKAKITWSISGYPVPLDVAREVFADAQPTTQDAWFWIFATPGSAERIRRDGHRAVGTKTTTWIPPQTLGEVEDVPEPEGEHLPRYA